MFRRGSSNTAPCSTNHPLPRRLDECTKAMPAAVAVAAVAVVVLSAVAGPTAVVPWPVVPSAALALDLLAALFQP